MEYDYNNPLHEQDDNEPCQWCGAIWQTADFAGSEARVMDHAHGCEFTNHWNDKRNAPVLTFDLWEYREFWEAETWYCASGHDCLNATPHGGQWLGWSCEGDYNTPHIAVFANGSAKMVCEDCAAKFDVSILSSRLQQEIDNMEGN